MICSVVDWDLLIPLVKYMVNSFPKEGDYISPFETVFGRRLDHVFENELFEFDHARHNDDLIGHMGRNLQNGWIQKFRNSIKEDRDEKETKLSDLQEGEKVYVYDPSKDLKTHSKFREYWFKCTILKKHTKRVYSVLYDDGSIKRKSGTHQKK